MCKLLEKVLRNLTGSSLPKIMWPYSPVFTLTCLKWSEFVSSSFIRPTVLPYHRFVFSKASLLLTSTANPGTGTGIYFRSTPIAVFKNCCSHYIKHLFRCQLMIDYNLINPHRKLDNVFRQSFKLSLSSSLSLFQWTFSYFRNFHELRFCRECCNNLFSATGTSFDLINSIEEKFPA